MPARNDDLRDALRRAASVLRAEGPDFALAGGYALWVFGAPEPVHDVDLVVAEPDVEKAAATLEAAGFTIERAPEDWLFKVCVGDDFVIDVLHRLNGRPVTADAIMAADEYDVLAIRMRVLRPTYVMIEKLNALNEHHCDYTTLLPAVRAVREQLDWAELRNATADNPFASAFLFLAERLSLTS
jgi:hypothetical protein